MKIRHYLNGAVLILFIGCNGFNKTKVIPSLRMEETFNNGWSYAIDSLERGIPDEWNIGIPATLKKTITLPHTWNIEDGLERYFGMVWYEKVFTVPINYENKLVRLKFGAINRNAAIYLNGKLVQHHTGAGYTTFYSDVTKFIHFGKENRIVIGCDNKFTKQSIPYDWAFDWANDGGIYRDVSLIVTNKTAFDYIHVTPAFKIEGKKYMGSLQIKAKLVESAKSMGNELKVLLKIKEENQKTQNIVFNESVTFIKSGDFYFSTIEVNPVNLWHFDHPNLYKIELGLLENSEIVDDYQCITGFRKFEVKQNQFYLNDEKVRLSGLEWMPGSNPMKGFAEDTIEIYKMLTLLKEANAVFTRFHWQQDEKVIDWCNRKGVLVQEEIPHWQLPNNLSDSVINSVNTHLTEMIVRDFNAPCIFSWGIGNELQGQSEEVYSFLKDRRNYIFKELDSTRLVSYASNTLHENPSKDAAGIGDFLMWNDYQGSWHGNRTDSIGFMLDAMNKAFPEKPIVIAEFGLCEPHFKGGDQRRIVDMKTHIDYYLNREFLAGAIYFCLNDYRTHFGESGEGKYRQRIHGLTDLIGNKKPSYRYLQNTWSPVIIEKMEDEGNKLLIQLKCKASLPSYSIEGYTVVAITGTEEKERISLPRLEPGDSIQISIKKAAAIQVFRPNGFICNEIEIN